MWKRELAGAVVVNREPVNECPTPRGARRGKVMWVRTLGIGKVGKLRSEAPRPELHNPTLPYLNMFITLHPHRGD